MRLLLLLLLLTFVTQAQQPFIIAGHTIRAGSMQSFIAPVAETEVPITVFHGARPGPVLTLTAGIHGDEFPSILALQQLRNSLKAGDMSGTLVLVHLANVAGFYGRRIALSPVDNKNLNRVFPGKPDGTQTERVAHFLTTEVIARTDYLIDMHSGSTHERLWQHVYSPVMGDAALDAKTLAFAKATGLRYIILYGDRPRDPARSISYPNTAMTRGKPALTIELGQRGERSEEQVSAYLAAITNTLRHLRLVPGEEVSNDGFVLIKKVHDVECPSTGVFFPQAKPGELVDKGALLGEVTNNFGEKIAELRAPVRGLVLSIYDMPPVKQGETPVTMGELQ